MVEYKRQHYVPQFYLKYFSLDGNISLYNLEYKKSFTLDPISCCSKSYFYSKKPDVEKTFSKLESFDSVILNNIIENKTMTLMSEQDYIHLVSFILMQSGRTLSAGKQNLELINKLFDNLKSTISDEELEKNNIKRESLDKVKLAHKHPALYSTVVSLASGILISDLQPVLLINETKKDFITSDNPVVLFNSFFNKTPFGAGYTSKGLQIFYPINPKLLLFFYDPNYYYIPRLTNQFRIKIHKTKDIRRLNALQILNCDENVYYPNPLSHKYISVLSEELKNLKPTDKMHVSTVATKKENNLIKGSVQYYKKNINYNLNLSFLNVNPHADKSYGIRNPKILDIYRKFMDDIDKKIK